MNIFLDDTELEEIQPLKPTEDNGRVITPDRSNTGRKPNEEAPSDAIKEIMAMDALTLGARKAAEIHGLSKSAINTYTNGNHVGEESKARILDAKYKIQDVALTKLMSTLNLLDPTEEMSTKTKITVINGLGNLVDKLGDRSDGRTDRAVHLHLHAPPQKKETDYDVIDV